MSKAVSIKEKKSNSKVVRLDAKKSKLDRWVNAVNNFGGANDAVTRTYFARDYAVGKEELENLYEGDWLSRRVIEVPAKDTTREFIRFVHDNPKVVDLMNDEFERLEIRDKVEEAQILQRLYGGCAMVIGAFDGREMDQPLGRVREVEFFNNVDRFLAYPMTFYRDPEQANFGTVETYQVQSLTIVGAKVFQVHESRVIRWDGNYLPPVLRVRNFGWGAPILHNVFEAMRQFGISSQSGASVLQDFIVKKLKIANLQELLTTADGEEQLITRLQIMAQEMAINNIAVYGADEEFDKMGTPITGLPDLMDRFQDIVSAAVEIPKSRLFHNMTGKLGGDASDADLRTHYDNMRAMQENRLSSNIRKIIDVVSEPHGFEAGAIGFEWVPLWQLSELDEAEHLLKVAQRDEIYINTGVVEPEEVAVSRFEGDEMNTGTLAIDVSRRKKFLAELAKQPVDLSEREPEENEEKEPGKEEDGEED